ncbi:jerky protein homolog-like [Trichonephila clavipes]|nr:jerky protein homolog-like [Trichonephila clavipes]
MITNFFIPELNNHDVQELWFQQDGATCHTARAIIDLLKDTFGDRLISRFGPVNWPPRSCDLTPLDYFLWGYVKSLVYTDKPQTLDHLEDNIRRVIADIRPQMLEKVIENWTSRLDYIRANRGSPMPEIIFKIRSKGDPTSSPLLCEKALEPEKKLRGSADFKASTGWLKNFKSHHGIQEQQIERASLSGDKNSAHKFKETLLQSVEGEGYSRDEVYKVDETGVNWKALPRKSLASKRESTALGFIVSKERVTAMVCVSASGNYTVPLLVIDKSKKPRCFKNVSCLPTHCKIVTFVQEESDPVDDEMDEDEDKNNSKSSKGPSNIFCIRDSCGMVRITIRVLSYSTAAAIENQTPYSEKTKVYNGTEKNK